MGGHMVMIFIVLFVSCLLAQTDPLPPGTGNKYCKMFFKAKLHCYGFIILARIMIYTILN